MAPMLSTALKGQLWTVRCPKTESPISTYPTCMNNHISTAGITCIVLLCAATMLRFSFLARPFLTIYTLGTN